MGGSALWTDIRTRPNGKKYLIIGNHDFKHLRQKYESYFEHIAMQMYIQFDQKTKLLNHRPFLCYGSTDHGFWQLFGHVHSDPYNKGKDNHRLTMILPTQYDVGVDNNHTSQSPTPKSRPSWQGSSNRPVQLKTPAHPTPKPTNPKQTTPIKR